jgi:hypothetical protein
MASVMRPKAYWPISSWLVLAAILLTLDSAGAVSRGKPGTDQRKAWCAEQRGLCQDDDTRTVTKSMETARLGILAEVRRLTSVASLLAQIAGARRRSG